jgi:hypothetical protein
VRIDGEAGKLGQTWLRRHLAQQQGCLDVSHPSIVPLEREPQRNAIGELIDASVISEMGVPDSCTLDSWATPSSDDAKYQLGRSGQHETTTRQGKRHFVPAVAHTASSTLYTKTCKNSTVKH